MIEVNLYSIPARDINATVGRCIDRTRFNKEAMGTSVMEFVKGFLKTNVQNFESSVQNGDIINFINGDQPMSTKDFACINYYLAKAGFLVQIQNVTDDEENPVNVPAGTIEWNIIDGNFIQNDYPTTIKIIPAEGSDISTVMKQIVEQSGLFDENKFGGIKNPIKELVNGIEKIKSVTGAIDPALTTRVYEILDQVGIKVFCATSEE